MEEAFQVTSTRLDGAMIHFLTGSPTSSIVGATASLLLECDEAQDVEIAKWDKEIAPMAASHQRNPCILGHRLDQ